MCKCTPGIRTPFCGIGECQWPEQKKVMPKREHKTPLRYYLTLFKIEGHDTWRASLSQHENGFQDSIAALTKVTEKRVVRTDRITGTLSIPEIEEDFI